MDPATSTERNGSRLNKVLLLRLDPEGFDPDTKEHSADEKGPKRDQSLSSC